MNDVFTIAEIAQAHDGSLGMAHAYIDALAGTGVTAVKFQTHIAEAESSVHEPFRIKFSDQDETRFDYWKRMEFAPEQWAGLKQHCEEKGLEFMSSPFSNAAVDLLEKIGVKRYKIGSGEVSNFLLLERIAKTGKPVIISSGMSSFDELDATVNKAKSLGMDYSIMQCSSNYPTKPEQYGLNLISEFKDRYKVSVGFSDHSARIETCLAAVTLGAELIEFHAVLNKDSFGPDVSSSLTISEISELIQGVNNICRALQNPVDKSDNSSYSEMKTIFEKSLAVNKDLNKGHVLRFEDLEAKKPYGQGIPATDFDQVIGKALNKDCEKWQFLNKTDIDI